jgi:O-antigen/teichoic acid export membrane protein
MPLYTRLLPPDEYGRMSVLTSYEQVFLIFATFEIYLGSFQRGILKFKDDIKTFEQSTVLISNGLTIIIFVIVSS